MYLMFFFFFIFTINAVFSKIFLFLNIINEIYSVIRLTSKYALEI